MCVFVLGAPASLFVGNLPFDCDEDTLMEFFTNGGFKPTGVRLIFGNDGRAKG